MSQPLLDVLPTRQRMTPQALRLRLVLIFALSILAFAALVLVPPFPQDLTYHNFADQRTLLNIPHALNVLSNLPFTVVGVLGLSYLLRAEVMRPGGPFLEAWERWGFVVLFAFVTLTGFGSMYYHANPNNDTLYWDRLPLTVVFMAFFALILGERISLRAGSWLLLPLVLLGVFSVTYWHWTERQGAGDVRFYLFVQFFPLLLIPLLLLWFPPRYTHTADLFAALGCYVLAKVLELLDAPIYAAGRLVSGHTLKHLIAALGAYWILRLLKVRRPLVIGAEK
jgi:hypothetical protein